MARLSAKSAIRAAQREDKSARAPAKPVGKPSSTADSFVNFAHKMGVGADSPLSTGSYGFNPVTRNRTMLEWIHRGSWIGGVAVDVVADDMTRAGVEFISEMSPDDEATLHRQASKLGVWAAINEGIRWGRLYGGAIVVALIDGQDMRTPLRPETVGPKQFRGLLTLDRWMVEPTTEDIVTEFGPHLGLPKYYRVQANAPALRGVVVHHSRVMVRHVGVELPYSQRLQEMLWGISVIERLFDRMVAFDSATTGAAQLVYKAYLRTFSIKGMREVVAMGGKAMEGLAAYAEQVRRYQSIEGMTMIDADDKFEAQSHSAFSGLSDALTQFGQQLSGALQIPLVRLFGQSPSGLNSNGEADIRQYYDHINQQQVKVLGTGIETIYQLLANSNGIALPEGFSVDFRPLWEMSDKEKGELAGSIGSTVGKAVDDGLIGRQTALKELRQSARKTGIFTNITEEMIEAADDEVGPPPGSMPEGGGFDAEGNPLPPGEMAPPGLPGEPGEEKPPGVPGELAAPPQPKPQLPTKEQP